MSGSPGPVVVERVEVSPARIDAVVRITDPARDRTSSMPGIADRALSLLPGLRRHTCENDAGLHFAAEIADTETAHLLEHVTVELMALAGSPRSLHAETSWDFRTDGRGRYRLAIDYDDDLVVLGALKEATALVAWLASPDVAGPAPDMSAIASRLTELRRR